MKDFGTSLTELALAIFYQHDTLVSTVAWLTSENIFTDQIDSNWCKYTWGSQTHTKLAIIKKALPPHKSGFIDPITH